MLLEPCQCLQQHHCIKRRVTALPCIMLQLAGMLDAACDRRSSQSALSSPTQSCHGHLLRPSKPLPALCSKLALLQQHIGLQASSTGHHPNVAVLALWSFENLIFMLHGHPMQPLTTTFPVTSALAMAAHIQTSRL